MKGRIKCTIKSQDTIQEAEQKSESPRIIVIVVDEVQIYSVVSSSNTQISFREAQESQIDPREGKKANIWDFFDKIYSIARLVNALDVSFQSHWFHSCVTFVKTHFPHFWHK